VGLVADQRATEPEGDIMSVRHRVEAIVGFAVAAGLLATGAILVASAGPASAAPISGGVLQLVATPGVLSDQTMAPGDTIYWPIDANLNATTTGELTLQITSSDLLATNPGGLRLALASCPVAWDMSHTPAQPPTCNSGVGTTVIPDSAFANISASHVWDLGTVGAVSSTPMMATISLPGAVPSVLQGASASINFGFTALGDTANASPSDPPVHVLGLTGVDPTGPALLAAGLLLAGFTLARVRAALGRRERTAEVGA
jgi:hypothetical protein